MIRFIKMLPYALTPETGDVFAYLDGVTSQTIDPPSLHPHVLRVEEPLIFHSPLHRVTECLARSTDQQLVSMIELREIPFSLQRLCTREEWQSERSVIVRRRFKEAFIADRLHISRTAIREEICVVLEQLRSHTTAAVVSHSFRLRLIEAFLKTNGMLFQQPELIHEWIIDDKKTYNWGEGFMIELPI